MEINVSLVNSIDEIVERKVKQWEELYPQLHFDEYGRAIIGSVEGLTIENAKSYFIGFSYNFLECFNIYLQRENKAIRNNMKNYENRLICQEDISIDDIVENYFHFQNLDTGKSVKIKVGRVLMKVQEIWLSRNEDYTVICDRIKELRSEGQTYENPLLQELTQNKNDYEKYNLYFQHQKYTNECTGNTNVILTINPLDLLTSSGGDCGINPTTFRSCWRVTMYNDDNDILNVFTRGEYSNPEGQIALGSIINRGMIYIANGKKLPVNNTDFEFIGYKERIHVWTDLNGMWLEVPYPSKSDKVRDEFSEILSKKDIPIINKHFDDVYDFIPFDIQDEKAISDYISEGGLFLDRVCINNNYELCYMAQKRMDYDYDNGDREPENEDIILCENCNERICISDAIIVNGKYYCEDCRNELFTVCERCGDEISRDEAIEMDGEYYCEDCANIVGSCCPDCGEWYKDEDLNAAYDRYGDTVNVCDDCLNRSYTRCDICECFHEDYDITSVDGTNICDDCLEEHYTKCDMCEEYHENNEITNIDNTIICDDCLEEHCSECTECKEMHINEYLEDGLCEDCRNKD